MRRITVAGALLLLAAACGTPTHGHAVAKASPRPTPAVAPAPEPVPTDAWLLARPSYNTVGYASTTSASPGDTVTLYVSSKAESWWADVYRMGWYDGLGGVLVMSTQPQLGQDQGGPAPPDPATGLVRQDWKPSLQLTIPDWPSGMYMFKLTDSTGAESYIPLVVRGNGSAPLLFVVSSATDEAYNTWGGQSLYVGSTPSLHLSRAIEVSFDRPFNQDYGAGDFFYWEYQMVRFLERRGIKADYVTDVDIHEHPAWLQGYKAVVITGHDEYWSKQMRDAYSDAVRGGVSMAVFAANTAYRPIRFDASPVGPDRIIVDYKSAALDPQRDPALSTPVNWRSAPTDWDEQSLLGVHYVGTGNIRQLPWVVADASSWVFDGTGLHNLDRLPGLLGYEQDQYSSAAPHPAGVSLISNSPVTTTAGSVVNSNGSVYVAGSGAVVFDTGSIQWSWGLDAFETPTLVPGLRQTFVTDHRPSYVSAKAQRIAENVLRRMLGDRYPAPTPLPPGTPLPGPNATPGVPEAVTPQPPEEGG